MAVAGSSKGTTITFDTLVPDNGKGGRGQDLLAKDISDKWTVWKTNRARGEELSQEVQSYVFATDTKTTSNRKLPWSNSTTTPKLCQIRDNLSANYQAALFPNDNWFDWEPYDQESATIQKAATVEAYMRAKVEQSGARTTLSRLLLDFIDYGNAFATVEFVAKEHFPPPDSGETPTQGYVGPRIIRISPLDIAFNPRAETFDQSPKIIRSVVSLGDLRKRMTTHGRDAEKWQELFDKVLKMYTEVSAYRNEDIKKNKRFVDDGVGAIWHYMEQDQVEILEFYGDIYDKEADILYEDRLITVVNRAFIVQNEPYTSYTGSSPIKQVGWRLRPDNLWAMGPLDNLVGLQYRIDHLENLKADVFDKIANPKPFIRGEVSEWTDEPGVPIYGDEESGVAYLAPDTTALNADFQIDVLERRMEEMAGAPKQAMGIRTPGEKTAFEVQTLENAAGRVFQNKVQYFESEFIEPLLNEMFAAALRSQWLYDKIASRDRITNFTEFLKIEKDDIVARGVLRPRGARHFAAKAMLVQNLNNLFGSPLGQDQGVRVHFSGKRLAEMLQDALNIEHYGIVRDNAQIVENAQTAKLQMAAEEEVLSEGLADPDVEADMEMTEEDFVE